MSLYTWYKVQDSVNDHFKYTIHFCFVDGKDCIESNDNKDGAGTIHITRFLLLVSLRSCIATVSYRFILLVE